MEERLNSICEMMKGSVTVRRPPERLKLGSDVAPAFAGETDKDPRIANRQNRIKYDWTRTLRAT